MGLQTFLPDELQAPIIVTVHMPRDEKFNFTRLYDLMCQHGVVIYPGSVTTAPTFRIGCIGNVHEADMRRALDTLRGALDEMGIV
jgi:2-aminoethylphosphonate-pyruvate transaminase